MLRGCFLHSLSLTAGSPDVDPTGWMHAHGLGEAGVLTAKAAEVIRIDITMECDRSDDVSRCQKITSHSGKLQENLL